MTIHPTAVVDASSHIDPSAQIGPYCVIGPNVSIGAETDLRHHVSIPRDTTVGERNVLHPFSVVGGDPQDRKYRGETTTCVLGSGNDIREHVTIHRGTDNGGCVTSIGDSNLLMVGCHVAHDCRIGDETVIANQVMLAGHVIIEDHASIGGGAGIHHFTTIGCSAFVGGLARVSRDVPPYTIVEGHPSEVRALNAIALSRRGFSPEVIDAMKDSFKRIFRGNGNVSMHVKELRIQYSHIAAVLVLCDSIDASAAGTHGRALESQRTDDKWTGTVGAGHEPSH